MTAHAEVARATGREIRSLALRHFLSCYLGRIFIGRTFIGRRWFGALAYSHLSNGGQSCPSARLVLFLGEAWPATLLARWRFRPQPPLPAGDREQPLILDHFGSRFRIAPRAG